MFSALYSRRRTALCESTAHHELIEALRSGDGDLAAHLMRDHLADPLSQLDLSAAPQMAESLRAALRR
ncbi:MAG: FCD domain-containing protein [Pseudomonadota bacterium]